MRRTLRGLLCLLLAAPLAAAPALQGTQHDDLPDLGPVAADAVPGLVIQPYLQAVDQHHAALMFQTATPSAVQVSLLDAKGKPLAQLTDRAVRLHELSASDLAAGATYRYAIFDGDRALARGTFTTWPADLSTVHFFAYGDTRSHPDVHKHITDMMAKQAAGHLLVLHTGDLVADGKKPELWPKEFFNPAAELFSRVPVYAVPGNHERESQLYEAYTAAPGGGWYYGLTFGPVHVTVLDPYRELIGAKDWRQTDQGKWLLKDLEAAKASPWRIAMLHPPLYSRGPHGGLDAEGRPTDKAIRWAREELEPLLRQYGFRLTLNGHDHIYERSEKDGLVMITAGGGGAELYKPKSEAQNPYSKCLDSIHHYLDLTADAHTLSWKTIDENGKVIDEGTLKR